MRNISLFSIPVYHTSISPDLFDKADIVSKIEKNYEIDPTRNNLDGYDKVFGSKGHHAYKDFDNSKFHKPNFDELREIYQKHIHEYLSSFKFKPDAKPVTYTFNIVNYTCMKNTDYMREHGHSGTSFFAVHYLKYNPRVHTSTLLKNPITVSHYANELLGRLCDLDDNKIENSWTKGEYFISTAEDDFVIVPSILRHQVLPSNSDESRITIAINIKLE